MTASPVEQAFRRHYAEVYRFLRRRTGDHERAEDLAQEVFANAAAALAASDGEAPTLAWLYTVAKRRFADEARHGGRRGLFSPGPSGFGPEVASAIRAGLQRLAPGQREIVGLKLLRGFSFAEIAASLGVSEAAAKMRFVRALAALREELVKEGLQP